MKKSTVVFDMHGVIYEHDYHADGSHHFVEIDHALQVLLAYYQAGYKIVILSSSATEYSRQILESLLVNYPQVDQIKFFKELDILSMKYFGSKDNQDSWQAALEPYVNIEHIYEDGEYKLKMAGLAAQALGSQPTLHLSTQE